MPRTLTFTIAALTLAAGTTLVLLPRSGGWTDGGSLRAPAAAPIRQILWQQAAPLRPDAASEEYEPRVSADGTLMILVRGRPGANADLFTSRWTPAGWTNAEPLAAVNTSADELGPELSPDGARLYFYSDRPGGLGGYDLWMAARDGDTWAAPVNLGAAVNSPWNEYGPAVAADRLYFASNRPRPDEPAANPDAWTATVRERRARRDYDLFTAPLPPAGLPTEPAAPLTALNTPADEAAPAVSPAGDFLYFTSDRAGGLGGYDLYRARLNRPLAAENLGAAVNSDRNDLDPALSAAGFRLTFSSDRGAPAEAPRFTLWTSDSREVFREVAPFAPNLRVWPALLTLLAALMPLLLLGKLLGSWDWRTRMGRMSLLARCLILSVFLHAILASLLAVWKVGSGILDAVRAGGSGTRVFLASSTGSIEGGGIITQLRGDLADADPISIPTTESAPPSPEATAPKPTAAPLPTLAASAILPAPTAAVPRQSPEAPPIQAPRAAEIAAAPTPEAPAPASATPEAPIRTPAAPARADAPLAGPAPAAASDAALPTLALSSGAPSPEPRAAALAPALTLAAHPGPAPIAQAAAALPQAAAPTGPTSEPALSSPASPTSSAAAPTPTSALGSPPPAALSLPAAAAGSSSEAPSLPRSAGAAPSSNSPLALIPQSAGEGSGPNLPAASAPLPLTAEPAGPSSSSLPAGALSLGASPSPTPTINSAGEAPGIPAAPLPSLAAGPMAPPPPTPQPALPSPSNSAAPSLAPEAPGAGLDLPIPRETFDQRRPESRGELLEKMGGGADTERAVALALDWFTRHQSADGRWSSRRFDDACGHCSGAAEVDADAGMTGLALLCFLGAGHTHTQDGPYRECVDHALKFLLARQSPSGDLRAGETMYSQTVATVALCEAYAMTRDPALADPARRAFDLVLRRATVANPDKRDASVLGWLIFTVESARRAGFTIPDRPFADARRWLDQTSDPRGAGLYTYGDGRGPSAPMTAEAMFVQQLLGHGRTEPRMNASAEFIARALPSWSSPAAAAPTHHWYYATLALFQHQGDAWTRWNAALKRELLAHQHAAGPEAGSWDPQDEWSRLVGRTYQTAICTLSLEVYYRYKAAPAPTPENTR